MRTIYVVCCVVIGGLVGAKLATAERQVETKAPQESVAVKPSVAVGGGALLCPLWPIWYYGEDIYMFYAERFENDDCEDPQAALYIGEAPGWPWICPDCEMASLVSPETSRERGFAGLERKMSADFRPTFPEQLHANDGVSFSGEEFVEFSVTGNETVHRAKLFRVKLDRAATNHRKGVARTINLGYEVDSDPKSAPTFDIAGATVTAVNGSAHAFKLRVGAVEYMVLLAK
jgi:hypothetical protein